MSPADHSEVEEISPEEVEVLNPKNQENVTRVSADAPYQQGNVHHPFGHLFENIEEFKKIRFFGFVAFIIALIGIKVYPLYLEPLALILASLDVWKGSRLTRKLSIFTLIFAGLILLSSWQ